jgi:2-oxoglutarate/2-oxoacid ferredoxin oxidoreductase subunit alpha
MSSKVFTIKIAGPAGAGIKSGGQILSKTLINLGFHIFDYTEYPSLVRGGHNTYQVSFSIDKVYSIHRNVDLFVSIKPDHWQVHQAEFSPNTFVLSSPDFPIDKLTEVIGNPMVSNIICLGAVAYIFNLDKDSLKDIVKSQYGKYADINIKAIDVGYDYAKDNYSDKQIEIQKPTQKIKLSNNFNDGNESTAWGFVKAGGDFYAAYPMTPSTGILHFLAAKQTEFNIKVIHPEDEISAINMVAGAAFAGARAATGSSGGGFALMTEAVSLLGASDVGAVIYLVSRPGPATGLPTWTAQGDLLYAIHAGHGEFPKIVLSPASQQESFELSRLAVNLAVKHQVPVIFVSDKMIAESASDTTDFAIEKEIIEKSPRILPGTVAKEFLANSYEHDDNFGYSTEDSNLTKKMVDARLAKINQLLPDLPEPVIYNQESENLIITWGSVTGAVLEAKLANHAIMQFKTLWPINPNIKKIIDKYKNITVIENNATSQLATVLKSQFDFNPDKTIVKYDGRPFYPEEINEYFK